MQSRNSPCHCGSGKKYKLCCLPKDEQKAAEKKRQEEAELDRWLEEDFALGKKLLAETEWNRQFPNGATLGAIQETPDGSTLIDVIAKEA